MSYGNCRRCSDTLIAVQDPANGRIFLRCPNEECERIRLHRRAQQTASFKRCSTPDSEQPEDVNPLRPKIEDMQRHYLHADGEGFKAAMREAREILDRGGSAGEAAEWIGFTVKELRAGLYRHVGIMATTPAKDALAYLVSPIEVVPAAVPIVARDTRLEAA